MLENARLAAQLCGKHGVPVWHNPRVPDDHGWGSELMSTVVWLNAAADDDDVVGVASALGALTLQAYCLAAASGIPLDEVVQDLFQAEYGDREAHVERVLKWAGWRE